MYLSVISSPNASAVKGFEAVRVGRASGAVLEE